MSKDLVKQQAEQDLYSFAVLVNPFYQYGDVHKEVYRWLSKKNASKDQLVLLPRGHLKSHMIAVWCAWEITRDPSTTILYVSATEDLAYAQMAAIKGILESEKYRRYWPEMINVDEHKREKWSASEIKVDHPDRRARNVRDATVNVKSIKGNSTGLHCDRLVLDDIVVPANAYTEDGRNTVAAGYSQFSSVLNPGGITKAVGTRYHPKDIYASLEAAEYDTYTDEGVLQGSEKLFEIYEKPVVSPEGNFLWPREFSPKLKQWYGFNNAELAKIRAKYQSQGEMAQYYAQYFLDPNDPTSARLSNDKFQYYDRKYLKFIEGEWQYNGKPLTVYCAADIAYTTGEKSDYTAIAVVGIDSLGYIYILDVDQFKTNKYDVIYNKVLATHEKWRFKKMRIETQAGANLVVEYIKDQSRKEGHAIVIEGKPADNDKKKSERIAQILEPRYETQTIWHYRGGYMSVYEEQLVLARPEHDDLKDAVTAAVEICKPSVNVKRTLPSNVVIAHHRFGGRSRG